MFGIWSIEQRVHAAYGSTVFPSFVDIYSKLTEWNWRRIRLTFGCSNANRIVQTSALILWREWSRRRTESLPKFHQIAIDSKRHEHFVDFEMRSNRSMWFFTSDGFHALAFICVCVCASARAQQTGFSITEWHDMRTTNTRELYTFSASAIGIRMQSPTNESRSMLTWKLVFDVNHTVAFAPSHTHLHTRTQMHRHIRMHEHEINKHGVAAVAHTNTQAGEPKTKNQITIYVDWFSIHNGNFGLEHLSSAI